MNNLITLDNVSLAYGNDVLLDNAKLQIAAGERICLIGRNGVGKSTLLKIIEGSQLPEVGDIWRKPNLRLARLAQDLPQQAEGTVFEFVAQGLSEMGAHLAAYHALTHRLAHSHTAQDLSELERLQRMIDAGNGWQFEQSIKTTLSRLELNPDQMVRELSGGWQRRAALARALVTSPELLLLDEPTNHLDIEAIQWLEDELISCNVGLLFITHDRALLQRLATRIIELDRGHLTSWPGDYANFLRRKEEMLHAEEKQNEEFDKKLAQEERWIRQGIKARRTRNEGRVRALKALREKRLERREQLGKAKFQLQEAEKSGRLVVEAEHISHSYDQQCLIKDFSVRIMQGDRVGLLGPNGIGKSTLLNILLGQLSPQKGTVTHGSKLEIAYFDQLRQTLALEKSVIHNVTGGNDFVKINGKDRHVMSYLADFLFTPQRAFMPVGALSGGECNRVLLARLFSQPSNLLVMDEPTNDLDIETLELLEELLSNYSGTLLLVSHDRVFLDNVVTSTLVFSGQGRIDEYIGGYAESAKRSAVPPLAIKPTAEKKRSERVKVSSQKQLKAQEQLLQQIEQLETEQTELQQKIADPAFYQQDAQTIKEIQTRLKTVEKALADAYQRWESL